MITTAKGEEQHGGNSRIAQSGGSRAPADDGVRRAHATDHDRRLGRAGGSAAALDHGRCPARAACSATCPGYLADPECFGVKLVSLMPRNEPGRNIPRTSVSSCFSSPSMAVPWPSSMRPRSPPSARPPRAGSRRVCSRGRTPAISPSWEPGEQARSHLEAMLAVRPLRRIRVWARDRAKAEVFRGNARGRGMEWQSRRPAACRRPLRAPTSSAR